MIRILYRKIIIGAVGMLCGSVGMVNVYATEAEIIMMTSKNWMLNIINVLNR